MCAPFVLAREGRGALLLSWHEGGERCAPFVLA